MPDFLLSVTLAARLNSPSSRETFEVGKYLQRRQCACHRGQGPQLQRSTDVVEGQIQVGQQGCSLQGWKGRHPVVSQQQHLHQSKLRSNVQQAEHSNVSEGSAQQGTEGQRKEKRSNVQQGKHSNV
eukprot:1160997-Pelagomonas_calceolata.AAC.17